MIGLGTILNSAGIVAGGLMGHFIGKRFKPEQQDSLNKACGVSVMFIAIAGAMSGMLQIEGNSLSSGKSMLCSNVFIQSSCGYKVGIRFKNHCVYQ